MTRKQRIFIEEAFAKIRNDLEEKRQEEDKPKGKYDRARKIIERKRR